MSEPRQHEQWGSNLGFVLATIGSAVGLGNIWRFAYVTGENGGAVFLLVYLAFVLVIGLPLMIAELSLGRTTRRDPVQAFGSLAPGGAWAHVGWVGVVAAVAILSFYSVIAGWALKYFVGAAGGTLWEAAGGGYGAYFDGFIAASGEPIVWQGLMLLLAALVVGGGVNQGIERASSWLMPMLAAIVLGLAVVALTLPGSAEGVAFLFRPDWSALAKPGLYIAALGQAFFSLGVGMAVFIAYGSYLSPTTRLPVGAATVALGDTTFAIVAGLAIFPAVFALGGDPAAGPQLAFITIPQILLETPGGRIVGPVFFFLLSAAALTSMVSLLDAASAVARHRLGWSRRRAATLVALAIFALGTPSALSYGVLAGVSLGGAPILDAVDAAASNVALPLAGLIVALFVGWRVPRLQAVSGAGLGRGTAGRVWLWLLRVPVPLAIALILLHSLGWL